MYFAATLTFEVNIFSLVLNWIFLNLMNGTCTFCILAFSCFFFQSDMLVVFCVLAFVICVLLLLSSSYADTIFSRYAFSCMS